MNNFNNAGIYKITNLIDGKFYIGRTINLKERKYRHFLHLRKGIHHNIYLQRAVDKYGLSNFKFEVLEYTLNIVEKEQEYFKLFNCEDRQISYNLRDIVDNIQPDETRYTKSISKFDLNGKYITTYKSIKSAAIENGINVNQIIRVLKGRRNKTAGFLWQYGVDQIYKFNQKVEIIQQSINGEYINKFRSIKEISNFFGKDCRHVSCVLSGKRKTAYGYIWKIKQEDMIND